MTCSGHSRTHMPHAANRIPVLAVAHCARLKQTSPHSKLGEKIVKQFEILSALAVCTKIINNNYLNRR